jgi:hypothetical protein
LVPRSGKAGYHKELKPSAPQAGLFIPKSEISLQISPYFLRSL